MSAHSIGRKRSCTCSEHRATTSLRLSRLLAIWRAPCQLTTISFRSFWNVLRHVFPGLPPRAFFRLLAPSTLLYSPYSQIFQSEAATALSANKYILIKLDRVSCTNYSMSVYNLRCSFQLIKILNRDFKKSLKKYIVSKILALQTIMCAS